MAPRDFTLRPPVIRPTDLHVDYGTGKLQFRLEIETSYQQHDLDWSDKKRLRDISSISLADEESRSVWAPRWSLRNNTGNTIKEILR